MIAIQENPNIYNPLPEREVRRECLPAEIEEIAGWIDDRKIKMAELWQKNRKMDQEMMDISKEIDALVVKYYRMIMAWKGMK